MKTCDCGEPIDECDCDGEFCAECGVELFEGETQCPECGNYVGDEWWEDELSNEEWLLIHGADNDDWVYEQEEYLLEL